MRQCLMFWPCNGGVSRYTQAKQWVWTQHWWTERTAEMCSMCLEMQNYAESLDIDSLLTEHIV